MAWRDRLKDASFRGAAFQVETHDHEFGRRGETHEYPLRPKPWREDLGRMARQYRVEAFILGDDYDQARDALITACETQGPGTLVHPYLGTLNVAVLRGRVRETLAQGGRASFDIEFVEAGDDVNPGAITDTAAVTVLRADDLQAAAATDFSSGFTVNALPDFVPAAAGDIVGNAVDAAERAVRGLTGSGSALFGFITQAEALRTQVLTLANIPAQLAGQVQGVFQTIRTLANTPRDALAALRPLFDFGSGFPAIAPVTPARAAQAANQAALVGLVRQAAAGEAAQCVAQIDFTSYQDAAGIRDDVADLIDGVALTAGDAGDDQAYDALLALRLAVIADVTARGASLARIFAYPHLVVEPALVIAQRLYGDATRDLEIVARNDIRHPGFVPAGISLELLSLETASG